MWVFNLMFDLGSDHVWEFPLVAFGSLIGFVSHIKENFPPLSAL